MIMENGPARGEESDRRKRLLLWLKFRTSYGHRHGTARSQAQESGADAVILYTNPKHAAL